MIFINMYAHTNPMIFSHLHITSMIKIRFREDGGSSFEKQLKADTFTGKVPGRELYCFAFWSDEDAKEKTPRMDFCSVRFARVDSTLIF